MTIEDVRWLSEQPPDWDTWLLWPDFSTGDDAQPVLYACPGDCTPVNGLRRLGTVAAVLANNE